MKEKIEELIREADKNYKETDSPVNEEAKDTNGILESSNIEFELSLQGYGNGLIFLGNFLKGTVRFTVTGRKNGVAVREVHDLTKKTSKWLYNWDTGSGEIVIIHTNYQNHTATYAPFYGCAFVWYQNC